MKRDLMHLNKSHLTGWQYSSRPIYKGKIQTCWPVTIIF